jgi:hypothetical protein
LFFFFLDILAILGLMNLYVYQLFSFLPSFLPSFLLSFLPSILELKLRTLCLLGKHSTTWAPFCLAIFQLGTHAFAWASLGPQPPPSACQVTGIIGTYHHVQSLSMSISTKKLVCTDRNSVESLDQFGEYCYLKNIKYCDHKISFLLDLF